MPYVSFFDTAKKLIKTKFKSAFWGQEVRTKIFFNMGKKFIISEKQLEVILKDELSELLKTEDFVKQLVQSILEKSEPQLLTD